MEYLRVKPPPIAKQELDLPRKNRVTLAQLGSGYFCRLNFYLSGLNPSYSTNVPHENSSCCCSDRKHSQMIVWNALVLTVLGRIKSPDPFPFRKPYCLGNACETYFSNTPFPMVQSRRKLPYLQDNRLNLMQQQQYDSPAITIPNYKCLMKYAFLC